MNLIGGNVILLLGAETAGNVFRDFSNRFLNIFDMIGQNNHFLSIIYISADFCRFGHIRHIMCLITNKKFF